MTQDVEMKEQAAPSNSVPSHTPSTLHHLKEIASLIETAAYDRESRRILRAIRLTMALRRKLKASVLSSFLTFALTPGSEALTRLSIGHCKCNILLCGIVFSPSSYGCFHAD